MSVFSLCDRTFDIDRMTAFVVDSVAVPTTETDINADRTPTQQYSVEVQISGTGSSFGTVRVAGTVSGSPVTEDLSFSRIGRKTTLRRFDASTAITLTVLSGWGSNLTVQARAVSPDGSPLPLLYSVATSFPGRYDRGSSRWPGQLVGQVPDGRIVIIIPYQTTYTPRRGDRLTDTSSSEIWLAESATPQDDAITLHHYEVDAKPYEADATT